MDFSNYLNNSAIYQHACNPSHFCDCPEPAVVEDATEEEVVPVEEEEAAIDEVTTEEEVTE